MTPILQTELPELIRNCAREKGYPQASKRRLTWIQVRLVRLVRVVLRSRFLSWPGSQKAAEIPVARPLYARIDPAENARPRGNVVPNDTVLETEDLAKDFAGFVAVRGVSLRVARGSIHAMIGPNGAGKTTCFNLLTKFLRPSRGRIIFDGRDITALRPADVARLGMVRSFQISAVFPHLTVLENVRIALQ